MYLGHPVSSPAWSRACRLLLVLQEQSYFLRPLPSSHISKAVAQRDLGLRRASRAERPVRRKKFYADNSLFGLRSFYGLDERRAWSAAGMAWR